MNTQNQTVYQSGQRILMDGWYEVVATTAPTVSQLITGRMFPDYDGRAVCWHFLATQPHLSEMEKMEGQPKGFSTSQLIYGEMYA